MPGGARGLYRRILLLHRALPAALRALGDRYVKEEFRKHKAAGPAEAQRFLREWEHHYIRGLSGCIYVISQYFRKIKQERAQAFYLRPEMKLINISGEDLKDYGCYQMVQKAFSDLDFGPDVQY